MMLSVRKAAVYFSLAMTTLMATQSLALEPATPLGRYTRQTWTMENGLPQNTVSRLLQSRNGYLWAGTELGLARFDGVSFQIFDRTTPLPGSASFPDAEVRCLLDAFESKGTGGLWVGTGDGLVHWQDGHPTLLTTREGLPSNSVRGLAQTSDGVLWAWTEGGIVRWDGAHFAPLPQEPGQPIGAITSMAADSAGSLWVGTSAGRPSLFRDGHWQPGWHASDSHLSEGEGRFVGNPGPVAGLPGGDVLISTGGGILLDHGGVLTTIAPRAILPQDGVNFLARLADGTIAVASQSLLVLVQSGQSVARLAVSKQLPGSRIETISADREGCLWVGTNRGLARVAGSRSQPVNAFPGTSLPAPSQSARTTYSVQLLPLTDPLTDNSVVSILEDQEGDIWVGTESAGLHILRDSRFRNFGLNDGLASDNTTAIVPDRLAKQGERGGLWVGTRDHGLNHVAEGRVSTLTTADGLMSNVILSLAAGPAGDVWVGTPDGLSHVRAGSISSITSADGLPDDFIRSLLVAPDASLWIGTRRGLTHLELPNLESASLAKARFTNFTQTDGLGSDLVGTIVRSNTGDVWIATLNGLSRLHQGKLRNYTTADGLSSNIITALDETPDGKLWIGTQGDGLNVWDGQRFLALRVSKGDQRPAQSAGNRIVHRVVDLPAAIHAILHDEVGHLWLASNTGLTRVEINSLLACASQPACQPEIAHFTTADGLRSRETSSNSHPTAARTSSGELWFTTPRGVIIADPQHFGANPIAPPAVIEHFSVDDADLLQGPHSSEVTAGGTTRIDAGHLRFQFDYAGLSFSAPQKVRYQYMLEGFDHDWNDAGTRRTAYYTNIPPGPYRFRVRADFGESSSPSALNSPKNEAGAPSYAAPEATLSFELLPHFYQTWWFRILLIALGAALIGLVFRRRVLRVEREFRAVMAERNRIAREIHDTLAQGYVGISLQLEILGQLLTHNRPDAAARLLTSTQELVREGLDDARQSIWALRSQDAAENTLPIRLKRLVEQAQSDGGEALTSNLEIHGAFRALSADTEKEILRIAQESIHNVKRHAAASTLAVRLEYDERMLTLIVQDDGRGFTIPATGLESPAGHYGLTGMKERASLIQGEIDITSEVGKGTTVTLRVQARSRTNPPGGPPNQSAKSSSSTTKES